MRNLLVILLAISLITFSSCNKKKSNTVTPAYNVSKLHFKGIVDGIHQLIENGKNDVISTATRTGVKKNEENDYYLTETSRFYSTTGGKSISINFHKYFANNDGSNAAFEYEAKYYNFAKPVLNENGVEVEWVDETGKLWSSALGAADQTGYTFLLSSISETEDERIINCTFSCKLYDGLGNEVKLTDGIFKNTVYFE
ncbi:MAG: hypothetical protein ACK40G_16005 [Cytophagaceae bacterium]